MTNIKGSVLHEYVRWNLFTHYILFLGTNEDAEAKGYTEQSTIPLERDSSSFYALLGHRREQGKWSYSREGSQRSWIPLSPSLLAQIEFYPKHSLFLCP